MPGLPFGAAQQHAIPRELLTYENIAGIEYIEANPSLPYPRSAAYRPIEGGAQMRVRDRTAEIEDIELTVPEARAYIEALVNSGLFSWNRVYRPAQGTFVNEALQWRVEVTFSQGGSPKKRRPFRVEGEEETPSDYEQVVALLMNGFSAHSGEGPDADASASE
ncbi:MAG: hypothetical protein ACOX69_10680 [Coriobacteriales bacterium]|jgi:hypothetical protein